MSGVVCYTVSMTANIICAIKEEENEFTGREVRT